MEEQPGKAIHMFAGEDIESIIDKNGIGKALVFGGDDREVLEGQEDLVNDFAGVASFVDPEATVTRSPSQLVNQGDWNVAEGDIIGVLNDHVVPVKVSGAVPYKSYITLDDDGLFKALTLSATPTAAEVLKICGRALEGINKAGVITAMIWIRK